MKNKENSIKHDVIYNILRYYVPFNELTLSLVNHGTNIAKFGGLVDG